ncbi:MAG: hypothetical protein ACM33V_12890 [Chloroflexota bacterium]
MNTQDENQDTVEFARNSFPEPQTIPSGWDTSTFSSASQSASDEQEDDSVES